LATMLTASLNPSATMGPFAAATLGPTRTLTVRARTPLVPLATLQPVPPPLRTLQPTTPRTFAVQRMQNWQQKRPAQLEPLATYSAAPKLQKPLTANHIRPLPLASLQTRANSAHASSPTRKPLPQIQLLPGSAGTDRGLSWTVRHDVQTLVESFIRKQKKSGGEWQGIHAPPARQTLNIAPPRQAGPSKQTSMLERWSAAHYGDWAGGPTTSDEFPIDGSTSFEEVLRSFFRSASAAELEAMVKFAEPAIRWAKEEDARRRWIARRGVHGAELMDAFPSPEEAAGDVSVEELSEAVLLHHQGVSPDIAGHTLESLRRVDVSFSVDPRLDGVYAAAEHDGTIEVKTLVELISWHPSLRESFDQILAIGLAIQSRRRGPSSRVRWQAAHTSAVEVRTQTECIAAFRRQIGVSAP